jgi:uncharacterized protein
MSDRQSRALVEDLEHTLATMPVVDCHEHTLLPERRPATIDLGTLMAGSDVGDDLISSGMPVEARVGLTWEAAAPYLGLVRNTGFYRSLIAAFEALFGFEGDEISRADWDALSSELSAANARPDWYDEVLVRRARIETVLRIAGDEPDPSAVPRRWFEPILGFDDWVLARDHAERERLAARSGGRASTLREYLDALDGAFAAARHGGVVGAKSMLAYRRTLAHAPPGADDAARLYDRRELDEAGAASLEDFLVHAVADRAGAHGLPYQVHVGYGSWQSNLVGRANPVLLNPLIEAHRGTTFVLLHGGYPFVGEMATMAKNHPNVHLECGWLAYIAPSAYRRAMGEWLDAVPASKLLGFGADCLHVEQTLGALILTRRQLALALADKVLVASWPLALVESVARRVLGQNGRDLYRVGHRSEGGGQQD